MKEDYERKLKIQESHLQKARQKLKDAEKSVKLQVDGRKIQEKQTEIEKLNVQINGLKKKIKDEHDKFVELENRKAKELTTLNRQLEEEMKKSRQLQNKSESYRKKLDRKTEEFDELSKKSKDQETISDMIKVNKKPIERIADCISADDHLFLNSDTQNDDISEREKNLKQGIRTERAKLNILEQDIKKEGDVRKELNSRCNFSDLMRRSLYQLTI
jgi:DNA repair exonuclease SbcCD ATPase subunit